MNQLYQLPPAFPPHPWLISPTLRPRFCPNDDTILQSMTPSVVPCLMEQFHLSGFTLYSF